MLSNEVIEKVSERLVNRIEQGNEYILEQIGKKIKKIGTLTPKEAHNLIQVFKYGGDYEKIIKQLAKITKLNANDIKKMFEEIAKSDYEFSKQFYQFRNKKFIPYEENLVLKNQVDAIAEITAKKYMEFARSKMLGYSIRDNKNNLIFTGLKEVYDKVIDQAVLSIAQGKSNYYDQMRKIINEIGGSGLKTLDYGDRTLRLDSAIRMHIDDSLRQLHNETQKILGKDFDSDGVEITVHENPAPDHQEVQGKQFSNKEFNNFQNDKKAISYDGVVFPPEHNGHDRRSISEYNCKHYTFSIILGVNIPQYTNKQLQEIIDRNNKGFNFEGKHYSMYEGTQLQRNIEREIRKQKDIQIFAKESGDIETIRKSQTKITQLNNKYKKLSEISGLPQKKSRLRVSGYKRTRV